MIYLVYHRERGYETYPENICYFTEHQEALDFIERCEEFDELVKLDVPSLVGDYGTFNLFTRYDVERLEKLGCLEVEGYTYKHPITGIEYDSEDDFSAYHIEVIVDGKN